MIGNPNLIELAEHAERARLLPFKMLAALTKLGKLTPREALQVADEMLADAPEHEQTIAQDHLVSVLKLD
ncbi:hypothetical protein [Sphingomonas nostoxanthinifaciens]|uniref:hypothetical protein n=1 Tax=Sphingomonas nostoxanthinifaciens TaxID=2872652 RepID=UPI001CC20983|nr:hypothetical protein [Sphingomonas nostoxanthinifaciens]UAK23085.1 hypothetical protein K8P63_11700 [Sphingomonas nostoxanthinifaciens]